MRLSGLVSQRIEEDSVSDRTGLSRGDRIRNARLARMRHLLPPQNAVVGPIWLIASRLRWSLTMTRGCWPGGG